MIPYVYSTGEMAEWSIAFDLKSNDTMYPWVRIPLSPFISRLNNYKQNTSKVLVKKLGMLYIEDIEIINYLYTK